MPSIWNQMDLSKVFSVVGLVLNLVAALFLSWGLFLSDSTINSMSGTFFGGNPTIRDELRKNRKQTKIGIIMLSAGFLLQLIGVILA